MSRSNRLMARGADSMLGDGDRGRVESNLRRTRCYGPPACHPTGERTGAQLLEMRVLDVAVYTWDLAAADLGVGRAGEGGRAGQAHHDGAHAAGVRRDHALTGTRPRRACGQVGKG
jgi:hypothetical protein